MEEEQNNVRASTETDNSAGPIIGVVVILVLILLGGLYFWNQRADTEMSTDRTVESITIQNSSDDTASIEADLDATDVENVDSELNAS